VIVIIAIFDDAFSVRNWDFVFRPGFSKKRQSRLGIFRDHV
jgi:hypothetical protein